jgi:hypothetical protein
MSSQLPTCSLCKNEQKPANQTGSHIFSFFFMKGAVNKEGKKDRGYEIAFRISPKLYTGTFFGQSILPDEIERLTGKKLTEADIEELEKAQNPFTIDHLVCTDCEKRFGTVETYFNNKIYLPLKQGKLKGGKDKKETLIFSFKENKLIRLFFYVQIWRASAAKYDGWSLPPKEEEKLREWVDSLLGSTEAETIKLLEETNLPILENPLIVTFAETKENLTENLIRISSCDKPYFFLVNDLIFQFFTKESHTRGGEIWFYGLNQFINKEEHINWKEKEFNIGYISDSQRKEIVKNVSLTEAKAMNVTIRADYRKAYKHFFNKKPSIILCNKVIQEIASDDLPLGQQYSPEHIVERISQNLLAIAKKGSR